MEDDGVVTGPSELAELGVHSIPVTIKLSVGEQERQRNTGVQCGMIDAISMAFQTNERLCSGCRRRNQLLAGQQFFTRDQRLKRAKLTSPSWNRPRSWNQPARQHANQQHEITNLLASQPDFRAK